MTATVPPDPSEGQQLEEPVATIVDRLRAAAGQARRPIPETLGWLRNDITSIELMLDAAEHIEKLRGIIGNLSAQLKGHRMEAMLRACAFDPMEGPCRLDEFGDPHHWVESFGEVEVCTRCGTECGQ